LVQYSNDLYNNTAGDQQEECDREGEYANIRHYWAGALGIAKREGTVMVR